MLRKRAAVMFQTFLSNQTHVTAADRQDATMFG